MADKNALWEQGQDESVEVNQRALIDKVLARYSGEFTVFRELLQNADDAGATAVQIIFETTQYLKQQNLASSAGDTTASANETTMGTSDQPRSSEDGNDTNGEEESTNAVDNPLPDLKDIIVGQWAVKNNGAFFREEDWNRLKKIADGNPDEQKIGAFGVGFYSLFSVTEEPFVTSGTKWMGFYWKDGKDQLFARRGNLPMPSTPDPWTTFTLPARQSGPLPGTPLDLLQFLSSSITFMASLSNVELYLDGIRLGRIYKEAGSASAVSVPPSLIAGQRSQSIGSTMGSTSTMIGWRDGRMLASTPGRKENDRGVKWNWSTPKRYMVLNNVTSTPVHIRAEVIRWVYLSGSEKVKPTNRKILPHDTRNGEPAIENDLFLASWISSFSPPQLTVPSRPSPFASRQGIPAPKATPTHISGEVDVNKLSADQRKAVESSVLLSIFTAEASVKLDKRMETELEKATKKGVPPNVKIAQIYTGKDEYDASEKENLEEVGVSKDVGSVFLGLRADLDGNNSSRVYIGHATGQTTGFSGHMSARFIPTVERESIDLVDQNVSVWNTELLHVGGYLSRIVYETELADISRLYAAALQASSGNTSVPDSNLNASLQSRCLHALRFFTFRPSTPSTYVSRIMQSAFFDASHKFSIFSTSGVKMSSEVSIRGPEMEKFVKALPVLPKEIQDGAADVISILQGRNMIRRITFDDVIAEMRGRCFDEEEMVECIKWRVNLPRQVAFDAHFKEQFIRAGVFKIAGKKRGLGAVEGERIVSLAGISTYINLSEPVPLDGPFPSTTLPLKLSTIKGLSPNAYYELFGWTPFSINNWVVYLCSKSTAEAPGAEYDITLSPIFAEKLLLSIAKGWKNISKANQDDIVRRLTPLTCIPTQLGLRIPTEAYFSTVQIFSDLPTVSLSSLGGRMKAPMETVLTALGVRKHVQLQIVFNRMIETGDWTTLQLVKYLASVRETFTTEEIERLKQMAAFSKEAVPVPVAPSPNDATSVNTSQNPGPRGIKYKISELYEPVDAMRQLGLPVLDWGDNTKWRANSDEAKFLFSLGLQRFPSLPDLLKKAAGANKALRELALNYFFDKYSTQYQAYRPANFSHLAFVPAVRPDGTELLVEPNQVFSESGSAVMGFSVVKSDIKEEATAKLKISRHPTAALVTATLLSEPPSTEEQAKKTFEYLTNLLGDLTTNNLRQLKTSNVIPVEAPRSKGWTMVKPMECYFKRNDEQSHFYSKLFIFIDFGQRANRFLAACGVRDTPTMDEVARALIADPQRFYSLAGGAEKFKVQLGQIAASFAEITAATKVLMRRAPILLASRVMEEKGDAEFGQRQALVNADGDDETETVIYELLRPDQIIIVDDHNTRTQFREILCEAPQEDNLESLYGSLGSPRLSQLIQEECKPVGELKDDPEAASIRGLVLERLPLLLHDKNQIRMRIRPSWMQNPSNFVVKKVIRLTLQRTLVWDGKRTVKDFEASAASTREGFNSTLTLYIAHNIEPDYYEIANSLCKLILDKQNPNDSLLFNNFLSTDLGSLKKRGYNIDRIMNQQKVKGKLRESARRTPKQEAARGTGAFIGNPPPDFWAQEVPNRLDPDNELNAYPMTFGGHGDAGFPPENIKIGRNIFNSLRNKIHTRNSGDDIPPTLRSLLEKFFSSDGGRTSATRGPRWGRHRRDPNAQPTPKSEINRNVEQAIQACRPETRNLFQKRTQIEGIEEAFDEGYCDISGMEGDFVLVGDVDGIRIYAGKEISNGQELLLRTKSDSIQRFLTIVRSLGRVYSLPDASLHIFYNLAGPVIAFNDGGALFLNLRYFEAWHDAQVEAKESAEATISWFFTLAHEIAHNLVGPHGAEHEYYMSHISSTHLLRLMDELRYLNLKL